MPAGLAADRILTIQQTTQRPQPPCRRQIPIDRTARTAEPDPPAVSSPEACPTPADRARGRHPATAGVRQPFTEAEVPDLCIRRQELAGGSYESSSRSALTPARSGVSKPSMNQQVTDSEILCMQQEEPNAPRRQSKRLSMSSCDRPSPSSCGPLTSCSSVVFSRSTGTSTSASWSLPHISTSALTRFST